MVIDPDLYKTFHPLIPQGMRILLFLLNHLHQLFPMSRIDYHKYPETSALAEKRRLI